MNKQIIENTNPAQKEWNACLVTRNKQLTKELKEFRTVSTTVGCSSAQLLAMSQLFTGFKIMLPDTCPTKEQSNCYSFQYHRSIGNKSQTTFETEAWLAGY